MTRKEITEFRRLRARRPLQQSRSSIFAVGSANQRTEIMIAEEQDLRNYLQAPYDPFYGAQAARYFTRGVLHAASMRGSPRIGTVVLLCCAIVGCATGALLIVYTAVERDGLWGLSVIWATLFTFIFGVLAFALLSRLRGRNQRV